MQNFNWIGLSHLTTLRAGESQLNLNFTWNTSIESEGVGISQRKNLIKITSRRVKDY